MYRGARPARLDGCLADRGNAAVKRSAFLVADPRAVRDVGRRAPVVSMVLHATPTDDWTVALSGDADQTEAKRAIVARIAAPSVFVVARREGRVVAVGQSAVAEGWGWFNGIYTDPAMRGRRLAGAVLARLAAWAMDAGANRLFIQVQKDNGPARRAYEASGFRHAFDYWYRVET